MKFYNIRQIPSCRHNLQLIIGYHGTFQHDSQFFFDFTSDSIIDGNAVISHLSHNRESNNFLPVIRFFSGFGTLCLRSRPGTAGFRFLRTGAQACQHCRTHKNCRCFLP